ncbi:MAG: hypothetical protein OXF27_18930, partial [Acidobacteria bacterium]|nr:hypothetical protein [Acidobacteriota bacterium]
MDLDEWPFPLDRFELRLPLFVSVRLALLVAEISATARVTASWPLRMWESTSSVTRFASWASAIIAPPTIYNSPCWSACFSFSFSRSNNSRSRALVIGPDMSLSSSLVEVSRFDERVVPDKGRRRVGQRRAAL